MNYAVHILDPESRRILMLITHVFHCLSTFAFDLQLQSILHRILLHMSKSIDDIAYYAHD